MWNIEGSAVGFNFGALLTRGINLGQGTLALGPKWSECPRLGHKKKKKKGNIAPGSPSLSQYELRHSVVNLI